MRCRNCHTGMMETDSHCPTCHSSVERATQDAPSEFQQPSNLMKMLPVFGGAVGGLVYAAAQSANASAPPARSRPSAGSGGGSNPVVKLFGILFILGGGLFLVGAGAMAWSTWNLGQRQPTAVTDADLCRKDFAESAPELVSYTFTESKPTNVTVKRKRSNSSVEVEVNCLLVRAGDKWLVATVAPGFEGNELVGRPFRPDPIASKSLIEQINKEKPKQSQLLPYEFESLEGSAGELKSRYMGAGLLAILGLPGLLFGRYLCRGSGK